MNKKEVEIQIETNLKKIKEKTGASDKQMEILKKVMELSTNDNRKQNQTNP